MEDGLVDKSDLELKEILENKNNSQYPKGYIELVNEEMLSRGLALPMNIEPPVLTSMNKNENSYSFASSERIWLFIGISFVGFLISIFIFLINSPSSGLVSPGINRWCGVLMGLNFVYQFFRVPNTVVKIRISEELVEIDTIFKTFKYHRLSLKGLINEPKFSNILVVDGEKKEKFNLGSVMLTSNGTEWERTKKMFFDKYTNLKP